MICFFFSEKKIKDVEPLWEKELSAFVLTELPEFNVVKNFVIENLSKV